MSTPQDRDPDLKVSLGRHNEFVIRNRFETASIAVDIAISLVFIAGSLLFLFSLTEVGTVFFLLGSLAMAARPAMLSAGSWYRGYGSVVLCAARRSESMLSVIGKRGSVDWKLSLWGCPRAKGCAGTLWPKRQNVLFCGVSG